VDRFESLIGELAGAFETAAQAMLSIMLLFLAGRQGLDEAISAIDGVREALDEDSQAWVEDTLPEVYAEGMRTALLSDETPETDPNALAQDVHDEALDLFIDDLIGQLAAATRNISEQAKGSIREAARRNLSASLDEGTNARQQAAEMERELRQKGVKFIDRRGRAWGPREYSEMVLRTHTIEVSNEANLNTAAELGSGYVDVFDGGPGDVDEPCKAANGQVWSLRYARAHRTEHPNCRRAFAPKPRGYDGPVDKE
jgi:hypothetical protein